MKLVFMRHGESQGNLKEVLYGHTDYPLTDKGVQQVAVIKRMLADCHLDGIFSSPLIRAKVLAEALAENRRVPLTIDERLREIHFGIYEDMNRYHAMESLGDDFYRLLSILDHYDISGGEHQDIFLKRVDLFLKEVLQKEVGTYAIVAHFGVIKAALHLLMGFDTRMLRQLSIKPGAILKLAVKKDRVRIDELIQTIDMEPA
jgi:alpha-ribazole phosphatase